MSSKPGRKMIDWQKDEYVFAIKFLAAELSYRERIRGRKLLCRIGETLYDFTKKAFRRPLDYEFYKVHILRTQGRVFTWDKLEQRAGSFARYKERGEKKFPERCEVWGKMLNSVLKKPNSQREPLSKVGLENRVRALEEWKASLKGEK